MDPNQNNCYNFMSNYQSPPNPNPNFQNPPFNANSQNNPNIGNFPFCRPPYMFQSSPINPTFDQGTSMSIGTEQETTSQASPQIQTPSFSSQVGLDNIELNDEEELTAQIS